MENPPIIDDIRVLHTPWTTVWKHLKENDADRSEITALTWIDLVYDLISCGDFIQNNQFQMN